MQTWLRRKDIDQVTVHEEGRRLVPTLSWPHLVALGIGAIVGTGIYTLIGVGANLAGPAVLLSFLIAGVVCACAALAYAEMATMMPAAGSAYTYSYIVLGETIAWVVGWSLILEYSLVVSTVAVGWSGYAVGFLKGLGVDLPLALTVGPHAGGIVNLPAIAITCCRRRCVDRGHARKRHDQCIPGGGRSCSRWGCSSRSRCPRSMRPTCIRSCPTASPNRPGPTTSSTA